MAANTTEHTNMGLSSPIISNELADDEKKHVSAYAKKLADSRITLIRQYKTIIDDGHNLEGNPSVALIKAQKEFNERNRKIQDELAASTDETKLLNIATQIDAEMDKIVSAWLTKNSVDLEALDVAASIKFRNESRPTNKSVDISDFVQTPQQLIEALLQKNSGISIGEFHTSKVATEFIESNMALLKKSGVDTIYVELPEWLLQDLNNASIEQLRQRLHRITDADRLEDAKRIASNYQKDQADSSLERKIKLIIAAKEHKIDVVHIDIKGEANNVLAARIGITNFTWTQEINNDRSTNNKKGKFIIYAGLGHFTPLESSNGMVDEYFSTPVILFDNRPVNAPILKGHNFGANAADFYIAGGECTHDTKKLSVVMDAYSHATSKEASPQIFDRLLEKYHKINREIKMECSDISRLEPLVANHTPGNTGPSSALNK